MVRLEDSKAAMVRQQRRRSLFPSHCEGPELPEASPAETQAFNLPVDSKERAKEFEIALKNSELTQKQLVSSLLT
jgi:hypothetical protein